MTIDEAIVRLTRHLDRVAINRTPDLDQALRLGIEALKRFKQLRPRLDNGKFLYLPGETEE
jgi:hypothetical protein